VKHWGFGWRIGHWGSPRDGIVVAVERSAQRYGADGWPDGMIIDAPMLVTKLNARRDSSCHWECRSMMRPMGPVLLRGRLAASLCSGGNHCCTGLVPADSAAVIAGLLRAFCLSHSFAHCTDSDDPMNPGAVARPCGFSWLIHPTTMSLSLCQSAR
jgi:hypothetical protein